MVAGGGGGGKMSASGTVKSLAPPEPAVLKPAPPTRPTAFKITSDRRSRVRLKQHQDRLQREESEAEDQHEQERLARQKRRRRSEASAARAAEAGTPGRRLGPQARNSSCQGLRTQRLADPAAGNPRMLSRHARSLSARRPPPDEDDAHLMQSLQELRTRVEPPPMSAFGVDVPRAPASHAPRLPSFGSRLIPRILQGTGGHITAEVDGFWSARGNRKLNAINDVHVLPGDSSAPIPGAAGKAGTAMATITHCSPRKASSKTDVSKKKAKGAERPAGAFKGKYQPATIDCSPASIKRIAQQDNDVRSEQDLRYVFEMIDATTSDGVVDAEDIAVILGRLNYETAEGEVDDLIWEVDDDRDGGLNWAEFSSLYERARADDGGDHSGYEPRRLFSLIEFLMFDLDADGFVTENEAIELFYRRYGREVLFKKDAVLGMQRTMETTKASKTAGKNALAVDLSEHHLSFHDYVRHDLGFYSMSRQMDDAVRKRKEQEQREAERVQRANMPRNALAAADLEAAAARGDKGIPATALRPRYTSVPAAPPAAVYPETFAASH